MSVVQDILNGAFGLIGELDRSTTMDPSDQELAFNALNRMVKSWNNNRSLIYAVQKLTLPLIASQADYTSTTLGARPVKVEAQNIVDSQGVTYPLEWIDATKWSSIAYPPSPSVPYWVYANGAYPVETYSFYPTPIGGYSAQFWAWVQLAAFTDIAQTITLPDGYEDALMYNLAIRIAPFYGVKDLSAQVIEIAGASKAEIETANLPDPELSLAGVPTADRRSGFNWRSGEPQ